MDIDKFVPTADNNGNLKRFGSLMDIDKFVLEK